MQMEKNRVVLLRPPTAFCKLTTLLFDTSACWTVLVTKKKWPQIIRKDFFYEVVKDDSCM